MCGFAGCLDRHGRHRPVGPHAAAMAATLVHRGPDDGGLWADEAAGYAVGFRRLAILDLSAEGHQPMVSANGRWVLAFNGEIYNHAALRAALGPHPWRGHSDTETLLETIARHGLATALAQAEGMFALALWDRTKRSLTLARDRLGEKPLYYGEQGGVLLFGSELKALRRHPAWQGGIDRQALALYLERGWMPAPLTIHPQVYALAPGAVLTLTADSPPAMARFWHLPAMVEAAAATPFAGDGPAAADALETALLDSVRARMVADVPVGAFLSGGIDSSAVVALMAQATREAGGPPPRTFTVGFADPRLDESPFAAAVAAHLHTDHTTLPMDDAAALALVPGLAGLYDQPFADISALPTLLLCRATRDHVTVALAGDGGDELFGGYARFSQVARRWQRRPPAALRGLAGLVAGALPVAGLDRLAAAAGRGLGRRRDSLPAAKARRKLELLAAAGDPARLLMLHHALWREDLPLAAGPLPSVPPAEAAANQPAVDDPALIAMACEAATYLPDDLLVKVDRASMAASLEVRLPFLDRAVMDLAWSLPTALKMGRDAAGGHDGKRVLRAMLHRHVPAALVERPKRGFEPPVGAWLRGALRPWAAERLDPTVLRRQGLFDAAAVDRLWRAHLAGRVERGPALWALLMVQDWLAMIGEGGDKVRD